MIAEQAAKNRGRGRQAAALDAGRLGDFTTPWRVVGLSLLAIPLGVLSAFVALALLSLIGLFTNLFFFQRWSTALVSPAGHTLGMWEVLVPVAGGLIVGLMARYGSERIRGHGIPEAIEAILIKGSRIEPRVAFLKPLSSAIAIGSGGPFGAEGPIIMTGGAFGSVVAQFLHLTSAERKTLLVAGAAGGMSATFGTPVAAVLLAVELLLFEWKPRSLLPVALASASAAALRPFIIGGGPLFPMALPEVEIGAVGLLSCVVVGLMAGLLSLLLTLSVYRAEDAFQRLPIHWMWWPAIGGVVIGIGGLIFPQALGVGYEVIGGLLRGQVADQVILGVLLVKSVIWAVALGSGTSGGVLAPLLMMGGALGGLGALVLPAEGPGFWPLISMAAALGGTMRSPFTAVIFALELTHEVSVLLPLLVATFVAYGFTVLVMRRSILTEKVARRGFHLSREYAIDPLEILAVREVMRTNIVAVAAEAPLADLVRSLGADGAMRRQRLYPVVRKDTRLVGVLKPADLDTLVREASADDYYLLLGDLIRAQPAVCYPDEPLRLVVMRMAETGLTRFPVIERGSRQLVGMVSLDDLLQARRLNLEAEQRRERVLRMPRIFRPRGPEQPAAERPPSRAGSV